LNERGKRILGKGETNLSLARETMDLLETSTSDTALQDTEVLLRVDIERLVVDGLVI
jgi:hypothetical protein